MGLFQLDETWDTLRKMLRPVVFIGSKSPPPPRGHVAISGDILGCHSQLSQPDGGWVLLASRG